MYVLWQAIKSKIMINPQAVDEFISKNNLTLNTLKNSIDINYMQINEIRSWLTLSRDIFLFICNSFFIYFLVQKPFTYIPLILFLSFIQGLIFSGFFVIGHECGHYSFSKIKKLNELVGILIFAPFFTNFFAWVAGHNHHHKYSNVLKEETNWAEMMKTKEEYEQLTMLKKLEYKWSYGGFLGLLLGNIFAMTKFMFIPKTYPQINYLSKSFKQKIIGNTVFVLIFNIIFFYVYFKYFSFSFFCFSFLIPYFIGSIFGSLFTYLHHINPQSIIFTKETFIPIRSQIVSTFDIRFPKVIEWFVHDINIHILHHLNPSIPWYYLKPASAQFSRNYPQLYQSDTFSIKMLQNCWKYFVLDNKVKQGYQLGSGE